MKLPDGVVGLRKVKTVFSGEDGRTHLTWVLAYNAGIEVGSPPYEAIRAFAGGLKAPRAAGRTMEQSVMFLPVAAPDTSEAPPPRPARRKRRPAPLKKRPAQAAAKPATKTSARRVAKPAGKRSAKAPVKSARRKPGRTRR